ncbi:MAG: Hsp70 family protein [Planctomycetes bacterium]|nr:Hsp70 family protein [Planctomycetota bacterium]
MAAESNTIAGIDLGTTYSSIAWVDSSGHVEVLPNSEGFLATNSVVFFDGRTAIVGREAAKAALLEPDKAAECFKRDMGRPYYNRKVCGKEMRPEVLSAIVLKKLKQDAERRLGTVRDVVLTVPAYFDDCRRKATQDAGKIAGLNVVDIINEPTAAAICYGYGRAAGADGEKIILVYDLGGGTFDATLMRVSGGNQFYTIATDGDVMLGGKDWDQRIIDYVVADFQRNVHADLRQDPPTYQELALRVEECKRTLSKRNSVTIPVAYAGRRLGVPLDREKFKQISSDLLARTQSTIELLVRNAGLTWNRVDALLLSGGSTRMAMVREMIAKVTGKEPDTSLDEDLAVAKGAAIHAASLRLGEGAAPDSGFQEATATKLAAIKHQNVNSHSLGVAALNRDRRLANVTLIPKNSPLPATRSQAFGVSAPNASVVEIKVLEGEAPLADGCIEIGTCRISDLPHGLPKGAPIDVSFSYSEDGRVHLRAIVRALKRGAFVEIVRPEGLTEHDLERQAQVVSGLEII